MKNEITNIEILMEFIIPLVIVGVIIVVFIVAYSKFKRKNSKQNISLESIIKMKLEKLEKDFFQNAIFYHLPILLIDIKLSDEEKEKFLKQQDYKKIISLEYIEWEKFNLSIVGEEGNILDTLLEEKVKGFLKKDKYMLFDAYKFMLLEEAKKEAQKCINKAVYLK